MKSGKKITKRSSVGKKILYTFTALLGVAVILMSCAYGAFYHYYSRMNIVKDGEDGFEYVSDAQARKGIDLDTDTMTDEEKKELDEIDLNNDNEFVYSEGDVINVMVLGTDARLRGRYRTNSDAMVLVSINKKTKKIVISSFLRDILVDIPENKKKKAGKGKLNAAFGYGGAELFFQTFENNFGVKLDKFVHMDFYSFINIVNYIGGIDMYIKAEEVKVMNKNYIYEMNMCYCYPPNRGYLPVKSGTFHLNGIQALAYTRVRYVGGGDFGRTERQRKVIAEIIKKIKMMSASKLNAFAEKCLRYVTTNIGQTDLMSMLIDVPEILDYEQVSVRIPIDKTHHSKKIQGTYVLVIDLKRNSDYWYNLVYKDKDISEEIYREMEEEKAAKEKAEKQADVSSGT